MSWVPIAMRVSKGVDQADAAITESLKAWLQANNHSVPAGDFEPYFTKVEDVEDERIVELLYDKEHFRMRAYPDEDGQIVAMLYHEQPDTKKAVGDLALALGVGGLIGAGLFLLLKGGK